jgi:hypothetical protein
MDMSTLNLLNHEELVAEAYKKMPTLDEMAKINKRSAFAKMYKNELE